MKDQVPEQVKKERSEVLARTSARRKTLISEKTCQGSNLKWLLKTKRTLNSGFTGLTDNYIRVQISVLNTEHIGKELA